MAAVPLNNNDVFKKFNSMAIVIGLNKTMVYYCLKCTQIKTELPIIFKQLLIMHVSASLSKYCGF